MKISGRRTFIGSLMTLPVINSLARNTMLPVLNPPSREKPLKISLNAFSFNDPLTKGTMSLDEMVDFCGATGFAGIDITGYYFKGYPAVPPDDILFHIKRKVFGLGMEISGTGVRNDFTLADSTRRSQEVDLVRRWVEVAAKLGAPVLRIFAGTQKNEGIAPEKVTEWMIRDIKTCVDFGKQHGVIIGLQNHNDFIKTADQVNKIIEAMNSEWLGLILDTGSYRIGDPYREIEQSVKHAVNWQLKEKIFIDNEEVDTDIPRILRIISASNYRGYLPIETLGEGDPKTKVRELFNKVTEAMDNN